MRTFILALLLMMSLVSCVTTYRPIDVDQLTVDDYVMSYEDSMINIALDYDVLSGARCRIFSRIERKRRVSLVVLSVSNAGPDQLVVPDDILFSTMDLDTFYTYGYYGALYEFENTETTEVDLSDHDVPRSWKFAWITGKGVNLYKKVKSYQRFISDLDDYYLDGNVIEPGEQIKGLLLLPVKKRTPIKIGLY